MAWSLLLAGFVLVTMGTADARAETCASLLKAGQYTALQFAVHSKDYQVVALRGEVDGVSRTLVLLGERHVKDEEAAAIGEFVTQSFPAVATEGLDTRMLWVGSILRRMVERQHAAGAALKGHGSTIETVSPEKEIPLERGKKLPVRLQLGSLLLPVQTLASPLVCVGAICSMFYSSWTGGEASTMAQTTAAVSGLFALLAGNHHWNGFWLGTPRDPIMARSILEIFGESNSRTELLAVMGWGHLPGVTKRLEAAGFRPIPID